MGSTRNDEGPTLHADPSLTSDQKATQLLTIAELDFGSYASTPSGQLNAYAQFSPLVSITKLVWDRHVARFNCQRGNIGYIKTETWDVEAEYSIYRNGKLIARIAPQVNKSASPGFSFTWTASSGWKLPSVVRPRSPIDTSTKAGPFYDFDPYNLPIGTPVNYEIRSSISGCDAASLAPGLGAQTRQNYVAFDSDGNAQPDFWPAAELAARRASSIGIGSWEGNLYDSQRKVKIAQFSMEAPLALSTVTNIEIAVPPDYVVIGGGVQGTAAPYGHLVTASYPKDDFSAWVVSTKDHYYANPFRPNAWALAMKVEGMTRDELLQHLVLVQQTSGWSSRPDALATLPPGFEMLGGGFRINWNGRGLLATSSFPETNSSWRVRGKDHIYAESGSATSFVIGLRKSLPGVGTVYSDIRSARSDYGSNVGTSVGTPSGFALTGCGANVNWSEPGVLIYSVRPTFPPFGCGAAAKDHRHAATATVDTYAVSISIAP